MSTHETLAAALAAAQAAMPPVVKDRVAKIGPGREYRYADLATILATVRPVLGAHGLALTQRTQIRGEAIILLTELRHSSGEVLDSEYPVAAIGIKHQDMGGALTYARRYALCGLVGIAADEDDDGASAPAPVVPSEPSITRDQAIEIADALLELGIDQAAFLKWAQAPSVTAIAARKYDAVMKKIASKRGA
jgi:hypothetical protein